jgi:hypothetical protein
MTEFFGDILEPLREEADFTPYRGRKLDDSTPILALSVAAEQPTPQSLPDGSNMNGRLQLD